MENKNWQSSQSNGAEEEKDKRRKFLFIILLLVVLVVITDAIFLALLGRRAAQNTGEIVDTIVLDPEQDEEIPLAICGRLVDTNGNPVPDYEVQLHSDPMTDITGAAGDFFFSPVEYGDHTLTLIDANGEEQILAELTVQEDQSLKTGDQMFSVDKDGRWEFAVPESTLVLEVDLELDEASGVMRVIPESVSALRANSCMDTYYGSAEADTDGALLSPHGSVVLLDGTIHLHDGSAILFNGMYINEDGEVSYRGQSKNASDLPDGYRLAGDVLYLPNGTVLNLKSGTTVLTDGTNINNQGRVTMPDGTVIDNKNATVTMPDGTVISSGETVTTPGGYEISVPKKGHGYIIDNEIGSEEPSRPVSGGTINHEKQPGGNQSSDRSDDANTSDNGSADASTVNGGSGTGNTGNQNGQNGTTNTSNNDQNSGAGNGTSNTTPSDNGNSTPGTDVTPSVPSAEIYDTVTNQNWTQISTIDLFKKAEKLAPGSEGVYRFYVKNGVDASLHYKMSISEENHAAGAIPLEYRLKDGDGNYVAGSADNWLQAEALEAVWVDLTKTGIVQYTLEWRWPYESGSGDTLAANDASDTALGMTDALEHRIHVTIYAETTN